MKEKCNKKEPKEPVFSRVDPKSLSMAESSSHAMVIKISSDFAQSEFFAQWQSLLQAQVASFPGFLSLEISSPFQDKSAWLFRQRFVSKEAAQAWRSSKNYEEIAQKLKSIQGEILEESLALNAPLQGFTQVFVTEVDPKKKKDFRQWLSKIHEAEIKAPGFLGMYVQAPCDEKGRYWVTFLQFDCQKNLDDWLVSAKRKEILKNLIPLARGVEALHIETPYAGWFGHKTSDLSISPGPSPGPSPGASFAIPPAWKQSFLVLLVLFPIVMMEMKFLKPLLSSLNGSLATFIANALSVFLIAWPMMPLAIGGFGWWLFPPRGSKKLREWAGLMVLCAVYLMEIVFFAIFLS